jgi:hypothetical protein
MAVAGADFCVVAGDTRMSRGYSISCRNVPKAYQLYAPLHPALPIFSLPSLPLSSISLLSEI